MPTFTWWIDEPLLKGSSNPTDDDLAQLHAQGFKVTAGRKQPAAEIRQTVSPGRRLVHLFHPIKEGSPPVLG